MKQRFLLLLMLMLTTMTTWAVEPVGGNCGAMGPNVTWTLSDEDGEESLETLTISGTGNMADYDDASQLPWYSYRAAIKEVIINDGVTGISYFAFYDCSSMTSVSIPAGILSITAAAFYGCSSLASVSIPASVLEIAPYAFYGCSSLVSVSIPTNVMSIGDDAFDSCSKLESFNIPASVTEIGVNAFSNTKWYTEHADGLLYKDNWLLGYKGDVPGELSIENGTKGIAAGALSNCTSLTSVSVPASVTSISTQAFYGCSGLTSVSIGGGVKRIEAGAFYGCSNLASFSIPASVTEIGLNAFTNTKWYSDHADGLLYQDNWLLGYKGSKPTGELSIEDGTKGIAAKAFYGCTGLTSVSVPASVTSIGTNVFRGCSGLTSVSIGDGVKRIEAGAFCGCSNLASFNIPASVTTIGENAFSSTGWDSSHADGLLYKDNWLLESKGDVSGELSIENGTKGIAGGAFTGCTDLTSVSVPASVTSIGAMAFCYCTSLSSIILNSNPFIASDAFYLTPATVTMNLTGNEGETGEYWTTFYNENYNFQVPAEGTQVFKAALSGSTLALTELTTDKIVTKNNAVILKSTSGPIALTLTSTDSGNDFTGNSLLGVNDPDGLTADDPSTAYVLNKKNDVVGFYKLKAGKKAGVGKAYLTYSGALTKEFFGFEDDATSLSEELRMKSEESATAVYDLSGRRISNGQSSMVNGQCSMVNGQCSMVNGQSSMVNGQCSMFNGLRKGLYIVNGKKVFIK
jgi:hypothetical protein